MYKCPFCKSTNCEELYDSKPPFTPQPNQSYFTTYNYSYNDDLVEMRCDSCGIVVKIDPRIYKDTSDNKETD